ncbi:hypothetical protein JXA12_02380 [Candidatus Woesearchaeota archaeon]|nr:hypothetical protein [Candidatus Woesearchaeota archaeon]
MSLLVTSIIVLLLAVPLSALLLWAASNIAKLKEHRFTTALLVAAIVETVMFSIKMVVASIIGTSLKGMAWLLVFAGLASALVHKFYKVRWEESHKTVGFWVAMRIGLELIITVAIIALIIAAMT